jgi:hypothetical protein
MGRAPSGYFCHLKLQRSRMSAHWPEAADPACLLHVRSCGVKRTQCAHSEFFRW